VHRPVGSLEIAGDIAGVADARGSSEREARDGIGNEVVEVEHLSARVEERVVHERRNGRNSDDLAEVVDGVAVGEIPAGEGAEVLERAAVRPRLGILSPRGNLTSIGYLSF
jgi:hypothetical protein